MTSLLSRTHTKHPLGLEHDGQTIKEVIYLISLFLNNMTQPNDNSFYVTLTSQKTQEFPDNLPTQFQYRLPYGYRANGKWD